MFQEKFEEKGGGGPWILPCDCTWLSFRRLGTTFWRKKTFLSISFLIYIQYLPLFSCLLPKFYSGIFVDKGLTPWSSFVKIDPSQNQKNDCGEPEEIDCKDEQESMSLVLKSIFDHFSVLETSIFMNNDLIAK